MSTLSPLLKRHVSVVFGDEIQGNPNKSLTFSDDDRPHVDAEDEQMRFLRSSSLVYSNRMKGESFKSSLVLAFVLLLSKVAPRFKIFSKYRYNFRITYKIRVRSADRISTV